MTDIVVGETVLAISSLKTEIETVAGIIQPVAGVSLSVARGQTVCLVGESGSGKSMLASSIMRVLPVGARVVEGSVRLAGIELTTLPDRSMRRVRGHKIAIVPQDPMTAFDPLLTVGAQIVEAVRIHLDLPKAEANQRMLDVLEQVHLPNPARVSRSLPGQLSGGMNQRALIAMALATEPVVLIADEPTTALDVTVQAQVLELLGEIQAARGLAIVLITHDMGVAAGVADQVAVMYSGHIVEHGPTRAIFEEPRHPYTVGLIEAARESLAGGSSFRPAGGAPTNLLSLPSGCVFSPRCAYTRDACHLEKPRLRSIGPLQVACVLEDRERQWLNARRAKDTVGA